MPELLQALVGCGDSTGNHGEFCARYFSAEQVVFRNESFLIKPAESLKRLPIKKHEHAAAERAVQAGQLLHRVVSDKQQADPRIQADTADIGRRTMEPFTFCRLQRPANESGIVDLDVGVQEKQVATGRQPSSCVAPQVFHSCPDYGDVEPF